MAKERLQSPYLHDAMFYPSDSRQHAASMLDYLRSKAMKLAKADSEDEVEEITDKIMNKYMPYVALLETATEVLTTT